MRWGWKRASENRYAPKKKKKKSAANPPFCRAAPVCSCRRSSAALGTAAAWLLLHCRPTLPPCFPWQGSSRARERRETKHEKPNQLPCGHRLSHSFFLSLVPVAQAQAQAQGRAAALLDTFSFSVPPAVVSFALEKPPSSSVSLCASRSLSFSCVLPRVPPSPQRSLLRSPFPPPRLLLRPFVHTPVDSRCSIPRHLCCFWLLLFLSLSLSLFSRAAATLSPLLRGWLPLGRPHSGWRLRRAPLPRASPAALQLASPPTPVRSLAPSCVSLSLPSSVRQQTGPLVLHSAYTHTHTHTHTHTERCPFQPNPLPTEPPSNVTPSFQPKPSNVTPLPHPTVGFRSCYVSGGALSAQAGIPDTGFLTLPDFTRAIAEVRRSLPSTCRGLPPFSFLLLHTRTGWAAHGPLTCCAAPPSNLDFPRGASAGHARRRRHGLWLGRHGGAGGV